MRSAQANLDSRRSGLAMNVRLCRWHRLAVHRVGDEPLSPQTVKPRAQFDGPERALVELLPLRFRRPTGMLPLPMPQRGDSIELLKSLLNLSIRTILS